MSVHHEQAVTIAAAEKALHRIKTANRTALDHEMTEGDRKQVKAADGTKLGRVTLSEGEDRIQVADTDQLHAFLLAEGKAEQRTIIDVPEWAVAEALKRAEAGENIPGIRAFRSAPALRVVATPEAVEQAAAILSGQLSLERVGEASHVE